MDRYLHNMTAVVLARDVNLSIFRPDWLSRLGVFTDDEILENFIITPGMVQIPTKSSDLIILPDRFQWRPKPPATATSQGALAVLGKILQELPHTPFAAVGLNFEYWVSPGQSAFVNWHQKLAISQASKTIAEDDHTARYGFYVSRDFRGFRLKLTTLPTKVPAAKPIPEGTEALAFRFNYHCDLRTEDRAAEACEQLRALDDAFAEASRLLDAVDGSEL